MMKVVRNPSMQMDKFDRPVRNVTCHDNAPICDIIWYTTSSSAPLKGGVFWST